MAHRDSVWYHFFSGLSHAAAELDDHTDSSRRLHAQAKLRLMSMSDTEIWELAQLTSSFLGRPIEVSYQEIKRTVRQHRVTAKEWVGDLGKSALGDKGKKDIRQSL